MTHQQFFVKKTIFFQLILIWSWDLDLGNQKTLDQDLINTKSKTPEKYDAISPFPWFTLVSHNFMQKYSCSVILSLSFLFPSMGRVWVRVVFPIYRHLSWIRIHRLDCIRIQSVSEFQILESTIRERKAGLFTRIKRYLGWNECCKAEPLCPFHSSNGEFCSVPHLAGQWR
jgi:hypothetical protein